MNTDDRIVIEHHPEYPLAPWHVRVRDFWVRVFDTEAEAKAFKAGLESAWTLGRGR